MANIYDVEATELIEKTAEELKKIDSIKSPVWGAYVKTGMHKERPPVERDWWYMRAASILRQVALKGPIGVQKLRVKYGGKKNKGVKAEHFYKASGNIIRKVLQQLEKAELIKKGEAGVHKGRVLALKGTKLLNSVAKSLSKIEKKPSVVEEIKSASDKPKEEKKEEVKAVEKHKAEEKKPEVKEEKAKEEVKKEVPKVEEKKPEAKEKVEEPKKEEVKVAEKPKVEAKTEEKKPEEKVPSAHDLKESKPEEVKNG